MKAVAYSLPLCRLEEIAQVLIGPYDPDEYRGWRFKGGPFPRETNPETGTHPWIAVMQPVLTATQTLASAGAK